MPKYEEVDPYTGLKIEDAPANATGTAVAGTGDDSSVVVVKKKKKDNKMFLDARTKAYKTHRERLKIRREKRSLKENKTDRSSLVTAK